MKILCTAADTRFTGNTAIEYNGNIIAIWYIANPAAEDAELLASNLVHEMFHAFQKTKQEDRFPNDLIFLDYPESIENLMILKHENDVLCKAYLSENRDEKQHYLKEFMAVRKYRKTCIGEIIKQEYYTETIEGIAEYAGCTALKQISFEKFKDKLNDYIHQLSDFNKGYFDHRRILYLSGSIFCITQKEAGFNIHHEIGQTSLSLFEIVSENIKAKQPPFFEKNLYIETLYNEYIADKKEKFCSFLNTHSNKVTENYRICGYDPMNMIKMDHMILCTHFIMLTNEQLTKPLFIKGPILLYVKEGTINEVSSYIN